MKLVAYIIIAAFALAYSASAAWTLFPIATNKPQSITTAHLMELYEAVDERCRVTMVPSITNSSCNWTEPNGVSNYYNVTPPAYSYTIPLSTGLYISSMSTQIVVASGVTSAIVLTNWSMGFKNIPCTNFVCYDITNGLRFTNRFYQTALMMQHLDDKMESLRDYFLPPSVVATEAVATAYFNDWFAQTGSPFQAHGQRFPYMSETNWASLTDAGADDLYPFIDYASGISLAERQRVPALLTLPSNYFQEVVLGEIFFVSTNSYLITNGANVLTFRDITLRYVDREELDIASVRMSVWSNPANPIRWRWVAPSNGYASPPPLAFQIGGWERYFNSASNHPVQTNFSVSINFDGGGVMNGLADRNVFDMTNGASTFFSSTDIDGVDPKYEGSVIQFYWSIPVAYYGEASPFGNPDFVPGMISAETLNARYRLLDAMRYTRGSGFNGSTPAIQITDDIDWYVSYQSYEGTNCAENIANVVTTTYQYPDAWGTEGWEYYASADDDIAYRVFANAKWKAVEVSYALTGQVARGWTILESYTNTSAFPSYFAAYMGATAVGAGISSTQLVSLAKYGPTAFPAWPSCGDFYWQDNFRSINPYYIEWAFDKASWTP